MQTRPFLKGTNSILITSTHLMNRNLYLVSIVFWFDLPKLTSGHQNLKMKGLETEKITGIYLSFLQILSILKEKTGTMTKMEKER